MDPSSIKPKNGWVVVLMEQRPDTLASGIILPVVTQAEKLTEGVGRVIRTGFGKRNSQIGVMAGDRILMRSYLKYANPIDTDETYPNGERKQYFLVSTEDVMAVVREGLEVGVFSGRPQVPVKGK